VKDQLFREEAVAARTNSSISEVTIAGPLSYSLLAFVALFFASGLLGVVFFGQYTKKETVQGYVTTTEANIRVFSQVDGILTSLLIEDGGEVQAGQLLAIVSTGHSTSKATSVQAEILASMTEETAALQEQIDFTLRISGSRQHALEQEIDNALLDIETLSDQRDTASERLALARRDYKRLEDVHNEGLVSDVALGESRASVLDAELQLSNVDRELSEQESRIKQYRFDLAEMPAVAARQVAELTIELERLEQRITNVEGQHSVAVVAPIAGRVSVLARRPGQQISVDVPVLSILPKSASFYAELFVPSRSIGFVRTGSDVIIRYDAFPYQKYGAHSGTVTHVSSIPVRPHEADAEIPIVEASYVIRATIREDSIEVDGQPVSVQAGMRLEADVVRDRRRLIEWLFDPLVAAAGRVR
jgi:membrane fusion protein